MTDRPRLYACTPDLAAAAADLHAQRVAGYPGAIARGLIDAASAERRLAISAAIAADWAWHASGGEGPEPAHGIDRAAKLETLEAAAVKTRALADQKPGDVDAAVYAELIATLLWRERQWADVLFLTRTTLALRAAVQQAKKAA